MSSECAIKRLSFSAFLDKQLKVQEQAALEEHLCDCPDCSCQLAEHKEFSALLALCLRELREPPVSVWQSLEDKLPCLCTLIQGEFSAFLDGELTHAAQEGVREHLKQCPHCLSQFRQLNTVNRLIVKELESIADGQIALWPAIRAQLNANCNLIESELSAFIDQEMPMQRHRDITVHILECPSCSETVRRFATVGDLIGQTYAPYLPADLNVMKGVSHKLRVVPLGVKESPKRARSAYLAVVAVVLAFLFSGLLFVWVALLSAGPPMISSEGYLLGVTFDQPSAAAEALVYGQ